MKYQTYQEVPNCYKPYLKYSMQKFGLPIVKQYLGNIKTYENLVAKAEDGLHREKLESLIWGFEDRIKNVLEDPRGMFVDQSLCDSNGVMIDLKSYYDDKADEVSFEIDQLKSLLQKAIEDDLDESIKQTIQEQMASKKAHLRNIKNRRSDFIMKTKLLEHKQR